MKKFITALSIGAFSLAFSQGVNISKINRAYIVQDETNYAYMNSSNEENPKSLQAQVDAKKASENVMPYSSIPLINGVQLPVFNNSNDEFITKILENLDTSKVSGNGEYITKVSFLVDENGKVSNVNASGNNQTLNLATILAIYKIKQGFAPAQYKGNNVASVVKLSIPVNL